MKYSKKCSNPDCSFIQSFETDMDEEKAWMILADICPLPECRAVLVRVEKKKWLSTMDSQIRKNHGPAIMRRRRKK